MSDVKRWGTVTCYFKNTKVQEHLDGNTLGNPKRYLKFPSVKGNGHEHTSRCPALL